MNIIPYSLDFHQCSAAEPMMIEAIKGGYAREFVYLVGEQIKAIFLMKPINLFAGFPVWLNDETDFEYKRWYIIQKWGETPISHRDLGRPFLANTFEDYSKIQIPIKQDSQMQVGRPVKNLPLPSWYYRQIARKYSTELKPFGNCQEWRDVSDKIHNKTYKTEGEAFGQLKLWKSGIFN